MSEMMIDIPDQSAMQEQLNKPALEVGSYLAVVTKVEVKENPVKGSYGLNFFILVNKNKDAVTEGWDSEAAVFPMQAYVYVGKKVDGKVIPMENNYRLAKAMDAFGISGKFAPSQVAHRQTIVNIVHEPSLQDQEAAALDATHVVERMFPKVSGFRAYRVGDELAPVLQNMADMADEPTGDAKDGGDEF